MTKQDVDIITLEPREQVRKRPGMWISTVENPNHLLIETVANAMDEYIGGYGNEIIVNINEHNYVTVEDHGRGFEIGKIRPNDGKSVADAAFSVMLTSGKYEDDGSYSGSLGANGAGEKAVNFLSEHFEVFTWRNGKQEHLVYKRGILKKDEVENIPTNDSGTIVSYLPDTEIFDSIITDEKYFESLFNNLCYLCNDLTIIFNDKKIHHGSIDEALQYKDDMLNTHFVLSRDDINIAFTYTTSDTSEIRSFVNCGDVTSGVPITRIKSALTSVFNKFAKEQKILTEKEKNLSGASLQEGLHMIFNIKSDNIIYDSQSKHSVSKMDMKNQIDEFTTALTFWLDEYPEEGKKIINKALLARRAAEAAKKARAAVKANRKRADKIKILHPDKLKDAEYLGEDSILLVVEGLSAGSSMAMARDPEKYGILMLRGKLINAFTNSETNLIKNEELQLLFKALNQEPYHYNASKLRYGKVAICVDSDSDGSNIAMLIMCAIQKFFPEMIQEGRLCWLKSPLYIVKNGRNETYYYSDKSLDEAKEKGKVKGVVQRNKGLGSLTPKQAHDSMFTKKQYIETILPTDEGVELLKNLMGKSVAFRKKYIFDNIDFSEIRE